MEKRNYQKELDKLTEGLGQETVPSLLLHACCAPCSSYCIEYLSQYFEITVFFYNPNLTDREEYQKRRDEEIRFIETFPVKHKVSFAEGVYDPDRWLKDISGHEKDPEGGERCEICFRDRLFTSAAYAKEHGFDWFTTTLTISPRKNSARLNRIGEEAAALYGVKHLPSDFKKKNGFLRSTELSASYGLYRQDFCGCEFSKQERLEQKNK